MRTVATTRKTRRLVQYSSAYNAIEFETLYAILILTAYNCGNTSKSKRNSRSAPALFILVIPYNQRAERQPVQYE